MASEAEKYRSIVPSPGTPGGHGCPSESAGEWCCSKETLGLKDRPIAVCSPSRRPGKLPLSSWLDDYLRGELKAESRESAVLVKDLMAVGPK